MQKIPEKLRTLSNFYYGLAIMTGVHVLLTIRDLIRIYSWFVPDFAHRFLDTYLPNIGISLLCALGFAYAGFSLRWYRRHTFIIVMAWVACIWFPAGFLFGGFRALSWAVHSLAYLYPLTGTLLGLITILILMQPPVKAWFTSPAPNLPDAFQPAPVESVQDTTVPINKPDLNKPDLNKPDLGVLVVFHFVVAGLAFVVTALAMYWVVVIFAVASDGYDLSSVGMEQDFYQAEKTVLIIGIIFILLLCMAGYLLSKRKNYIFCLLTAILSLPFFPAGTLLGIFTLGSLLRGSVRDTFYARTEANFVGESV